MRKKVIVTGITGMDGPTMAHYLLNNTEHLVYGTTRFNSSKDYPHTEELLKSPRFKLIEMDLVDTHNITDVVKKINPDYFINFAANSFVPNSWSSPRQMFETNATAVLDVLEAIRNHAPDCRFYQASTSEMFGKVIYSPQDEKHPYRPQSVYGASKVAAHMLVRVYRESYGLYALCGTLFNHEAEGLRAPHFLTRKVTLEVARIANALARGVSFEPMKLGNMSARRDWSHARDFADGIWRMLNQEIYDEAVVKPLFEKLPADQKTTKRLSQMIDEYVLASGETHTVAEFVKEAFKAADLTVHLRNAENMREAYFIEEETGLKVVEVDESFFRPAEVDLLMGDSTLIRQRLGWQPKTTFKELVQLMVEHDVRELANKSAA